MARKKSFKRNKAIGHIRVANKSKRRKSVLSTSSI